MTEVERTPSLTAHRTMPRFRGAGASLVVATGVAREELEIRAITGRRESLKVVSVGATAALLTEVSIQ